MSDSGHELRENNEKIVKLMSILKKQRNEMNFLIEKQVEEKSRIQNEIERLSFKLSLLTKSLGQRVLAKNNYDKTIKEIEENYSSLVEESGKLLSTITKEVHELEEIMDKKIGTEQKLEE
nr:PREDICTED: Sjoegren syndrome nuclear autoantigen 1 homolog [Tribolium castaneum]|eukprot:XP_008194938.1 PREDICTED: Sjoegren syndrome nuclear autoantigen 1 homolog [Tribolium castaneum]